MVPSRLSVEGTSFQAVKTGSSCSWQSDLSRSSPFSTLSDQFSPLATQFRSLPAAFSALSTQFSVLAIQFRSLPAPFSLCQFHSVPCQLNSGRYRRRSVLCQFHSVSCQLNSGRYRRHSVLCQFHSVSCRSNSGRCRRHSIHCQLHSVPWRSIQVTGAAFTALSEQIRPLRDRSGTLSGVQTRGGTDLYKCRRPQRVDPARASTKPSDHHARVVLSAAAKRVAESPPRSEFPLHKQGP
jgi:hypothetical protein